MEIVGYFGALIIGFTLGLLGGGGSILAVPIFVYILYINPVVATAYSLFVVGVTSGIGAIRNYSKGMIDLKTGVIFATPAFLAVYLTRKYLVPAIPDHLFQIGNFVLTKDMGIMLFFALIMGFAAVSMIRKKTPQEEGLEEVQYNFPLIFLEGILIGVLTGIVGAGGGFLIIPALVLLAKLPMKKAVGTSLMIISIKSLIGFLGDVGNIEINWIFLLSFTSLSILGIFIGIYFSNFISNKKLKKSFGWFVLVMAFYILFKELI